MRGPPKTPTKMRMIRGNPGKRSLPKNEPDPEPAIPKPPRHLSRAAKKEWRLMAPHLYQLGMLSQIDRAAFAAYCQSYARWVEAETKVAEIDAIVKAPSGYPMQNPYLGIANTALAQMKAFLAEFGMTPASRTRVAAGKQPTDKKNPFAQIG